MNADHATQAQIFTGIIRRLLAIFYDLLLLVAILFLATAAVNALNHGEAIGTNNPYYFFYVLYILVISFFYYGWFWTHNGQTLGMKTWQIRLQSRQNSQNVTWQQALVRASTAVISFGFFGLGFVWILFDKKKRAWHDIISRTELIDQRTHLP